MSAYDSAAVRNPSHAVVVLWPIKAATPVPLPRITERNFVRKPILSKKARRLVWYRTDLLTPNSIPAQSFSNWVLTGLATDAASVLMRAFGNQSELESGGGAVSTTGRSVLGGCRLPMA